MKNKPIKRAKTHFRKPLARLAHGLVANAPSPFANLTIRSWLASLRAARLSQTFGLLMPWAPSGLSAFATTKRLREQLDEGESDWSLRRRRVCVVCVLPNKSKVSSRTPHATKQHRKENTEKTKRKGSEPALMNRWPNPFSRQFSC